MSQRQSNLELLRIVSMAMVVMVHLDGAALGLPHPGGWSALDASATWQTAVESLTIVGVNCFTLISGYFGIRARWSGMLKFVGMCLFYSVGLYLLGAVLKPETWSWTRLCESVMILTHNDLWYVPAYFGLYLLSPMLNGVEQLPRQRFSAYLGGFVLFNVWAGWAWHSNFNPTGYTLVQLIMMYLIGRYIGLSPAQLFRRSLRPLYLGIYLAATAATFVAALYLPPAMAYAYNSPAVIIASVALLLLFATFRFSSRAVNSLAASAFAVYLIHKSPMVWGGIVKPAALYAWRQLPLAGYTLFTVGLTAAIYMASWCIDRLRVYLFKIIA